MIETPAELVDIDSDEADVRWTDLAAGAARQAAKVGHSAAVPHTPSFAWAVLQKNY